jgi:hypothetical protein
MGWEGFFLMQHVTTCSFTSFFLEGPTMSLNCSGSSLADRFLSLQA